MITDLSAAQAAIDHIRRLASENDGKAPTAIVRATAERFECTERTVWGWLKNGIPAPRSPRVLQDVHLDAIAAENGDLKRAWKKLSATGEYPCGYRQFVRDVNALPPVIAAGLTGGVKEALKHGLYLKGTSTGRLDRVIFDHTMADIRLRRVHASTVEMFRPWVTLLIDSHTRVLLGCTVTEGDGVGGDPNTESLVALMGGAIRGQTAADGTFVGGVPRLVQFDNAKARSQMPARLADGGDHLGTQFVSQLAQIAYRQPSQVCGCVDSIEQRGRWIRAGIEGRIDDHRHGLTRIETPSRLARTVPKLDNDRSKRG